MNVLKYGNFFSYYLLGFSGIFTFVYLFKNIGSSKVLEYYGRNSLIVLALHFPVKDILIKLIVLVFNYIPFLLGKKRSSESSGGLRVRLRKFVN